MADKSNEHAARLRELHTLAQMPSQAPLRKYLLAIGAGAAALEAQAPMPCGHPALAIYSSGEGTHYCRWCADAASIPPDVKALIAQKDAALRDICQTAEYGGRARECADQARAALAAEWGGMSDPPATVTK